MHAWVREFFGAHCFRLNCRKTEFVCSAGADAPVLTSVAGRSSMEAKGEAHTFRYLGMWVNLRLDWSVQIGRMDRLLWAVCSSVRRNEFDLAMSVSAMQQYVLPCLRTGLRVADVPASVLDGWDARFRRAAVDGARMSMDRSLDPYAFYAASGVTLMLRRPGPSAEKG